MSVTKYFTTHMGMASIDAFESYNWTCNTDAQRYKELIETKRAFRFLISLNTDLDGVTDIILGIKPLPSLKTIFSEVRHEESKRKLMVRTPSVLMVGTPPVLSYDSSTLAAKRPSHTSDGLALAANGHLTH